MTIFVIIISILLSILILERIIALIRWFLKKQTTGASPQHLTADRLGWQSILLIIVAFLLIGFSFFAPYAFTRKAITEDFNFMLTGQIGDTIGGLMNPFIALAGVIVTGLAFYMQYKANHLQRELFEKGQTESNKQFQQQLNYQQFESQFYEMLRLHKENINELEMTGKKQNNGSWENVSVSKREVFKQMYQEFKSLLDLLSEEPNPSLVDVFDEEKKPNVLHLRNNNSPNATAFSFGVLTSITVTNYLNVLSELPKGLLKIDTLILKTLKPIGRKIFLLL